MAKTTESISPAPQKPRIVKPQPTSEEIAVRAYQIYLERGAAPGNELEDWIQAERELLGGGNGKSAGENGKARRKASVKSAAA